MYFKELSICKFWTFEWSVDEQWPQTDTTSTSKQGLSYIYFEIYKWRLAQYKLQTRAVVGNNQQSARQSTIILYVVHLLHIVLDLVFWWHCGSYRPFFLHSSFLVYLILQELRNQKPCKCKCDVKCTCKTVKR